jgi:hypothetical protein
MTTDTTDTTGFIGRPHDFDFLVGRWHVANRRLRRRHAGAADWIEFGAAMQAWSHLGGLVSVDDNVFHDEGAGGLSFRTLDVAAQRWNIHWVSSHYGKLGAPVTGGWNGDIGRFSGMDEDDGRPVHVRFLWERLGPGRARWSQDFALAGRDGAPDGPWETNWVMAFSRLGD